MKKLIAPYVLVGILSCGGIEDTGQLARDDIENEVASFFESYLLALETRDLAVIHELYVDDGRFEWIEDGEIRYRSSDDIVAGLAALPSDAPIHTEYDRREITPVGKAGARISTRFRTVIGEGPAAFEFGGMMTIVLEKGPSGWRVVGGHTSSLRQDGR